MNPPPVVVSARAVTNGLSVAGGTIAVVAAAVAVSPFVVGSVVNPGAVMADSAVVVGPDSAVVSAEVAEEVDATVVVVDFVIVGFATVVVVGFLVVVVPVFCVALVVASVAGILSTANHVESGGRFVSVVGILINWP